MVVGHGPVLTVITCSKEGVTQGCPLGLVFCGIALLPLAEKLRDSDRDVLQPWCADDCGLLGTAEKVARMLKLLIKEGPARGHFPQPSKSILILKEPGDVPACSAEFDLKMMEGSRHLGGFSGSDEAQKAWLTPMITKWAEGVRTPARITKREPQCACVGLVKSLQSEWICLQRAVPDCEDQFQPAEDAMRTVFLPVIFGEAKIGNALRTTVALSNRSSGLGILDPTKTGPTNLKASRDATEVLSQSLLEGTVLNLKVHSTRVHNTRLTGQAARVKAQEVILAGLIASAQPRFKRVLARASATGAWLTVLPNVWNGTQLSRDEWMDGVCLRCGRKPPRLPQKCDGYGGDFTLQHALDCKHGGLVILRHNDLKHEWHQLCAQALTPSAAVDEPLICAG